MKLSFRKQVLSGIAIILMMEVCSFVFQQGLFVNVAWVVIGLMFIINPVYPERFKEEKNVQLWTRIGGTLCILVGFLTRFGI